jgi:hypothetical protein
VLLFAAKDTFFFPITHRLNGKKTAYAANSKRNKTTVILRGRKGRMI